MVFCRFVGGETSSIGEIEFDSIGQRATFSEKGFREVLLGGAAFLPAHIFNRIGFTADELVEQGPIGARYFPSDSFCNKLATAQQFIRELRGELLLGKPVEEVLAVLNESESDLVSN